MRARRGGRSSAQPSTQYVHQRGWHQAAGAALQPHTCRRGPPAAGGERVRCCGARCMGFAAIEIDASRAAGVFALTPRTCYGGRLNARQHAPTCNGSRRYRWSHGGPFSRDIPGGQGPPGCLLRWFSRGAPRELRPELQIVAREIT
jgi:hypothetical protein